MHSSSKRYCLCWKLSVYRKRWISIQSNNIFRYFDNICKQSVKPNSWCTSKCFKFFRIHSISICS